MKYDAEVSSAIARVSPGIDPALVHAIIQRESSHGASLVTAEPGGRFSYGPMMVLDSTARGYGVADPSSLARDPALGILYGVKYLASRLAKYPGDTASAVAAYNAGSARRTSPGGPFVNQEYVNKVLGFWRQYRALAPAAAGAGVALVLLVGAFVLLRSRRRARAA